jgi:ABC-type sugar transport system substrate-binding protein
MAMGVAQAVANAGKSQTVLVVALTVSLKRVKWWKPVR